MTSLFDGMAGMLNDVFGAPVLYLPAGGGAVQVIHSLFRQEPVEVEHPDGGTVMTMAPVWKLPKGIIDPGPQRDDVIRPGDGHDYRILAPRISGSPAVDAFVSYLLERL